VFIRQKRSSELNDGPVSLLSTLEPFNEIASFAARNFMVHCSFARFGDVSSVLRDIPSNAESSISFVKVVISSLQYPNVWIC
jgi:hypothetical protein